MHLKEGTTAEELVKAMGAAGGFGAKNVALGRDILEEMLRNEGCTNFLSFPACIVSTGIRGLIAQNVKNFDAIVSTCGLFDHDLARAWGGKYLHGAFGVNDVEMKRKKVHRLGNIFIPFESYGGTLEKGMKPIIKELRTQKDEWAGWELAYEFGKRLNDENSILYQAAKHNVPVFVPGITDGAFGTNLFTETDGTSFRLNILKDEKRLCDVIFEAKKSGALMIGGGDFQASHDMVEPIPGRT